MDKNIPTYVWIQIDVKYNNVIIKMLQKCSVISNRENILLVEFIHPIEGRKITKEIIEYKTKEQLPNETIMLNFKTIKY